VNNAQSDSPIIITNTGNVLFNLSMTAYSLRGKLDNSTLGAQFFKAGSSLGSAKTLAHNTTTSLNVSLAPPNNVSLSLWLSMPLAAVPQIFYTPTSWQVVAQT
jgi:hypothetical protein